MQAIGLGSGGAWETPLIGSDGSVTYGIGNPYQSPAQAIAASQSAQLYTDSDVNLDAATGKLRWYYQGVPMISRTTTCKRRRSRRAPMAIPVVIGSGKMGIRLRDERQYRQADLEDAGRRAQRPRRRFTPGARAQAHAEGALHDSPRIARRRVERPGRLEQQRVRGHDRSTAHLHKPELPRPVKAAGPLRGEVEALNLATGKVQWDTRVSQFPLGATTVSNDLVFTTLYDGLLIALDAEHRQDRLSPPAADLDERADRDRRRHRHRSSRRREHEHRTRESTGGRLHRTVSAPYGVAARHTVR